MLRARTHLHEGWQCTWEHRKGNIKAFWDLQFWRFCWNLQQIFSSNKPILMQHGDFYKIPEMHRTRTSKKVQLPNIAEISSVKFIKGSRNLVFKRKFDGEEVQVDFWREAVTLTMIFRQKPCLERSAREINKIWLNWKSTFPIKDEVLAWFTRKQR